MHAARAFFVTPTLPCTERAPEHEGFPLTPGWPLVTQALAATSPGGPGTECHAPGTARPYIVLMRRCTGCGQLRDLSKFGFKDSLRRRLRPQCRDCNRAYARAHYQRTAATYNATRYRWRSIYRDRNRTMVHRYLAANACVDCGERDPVVLEFDHVKGNKKRTISQMIAWGVSENTLREEIQKCVLRCANCHRRKTASQFGWSRRLVESAGPPD